MNPHPQPSPKVVSDDERYRVTDFVLDGATVSETLLHPGQNTRGHRHDELDEAYLFVEGSAVIRIGDGGTALAHPGDVFLVPAGLWHQVYNSDFPCRFYTLFFGARD